MADKGNRFGKFGKLASQASKVAAEAAATAGKAAAEAAANAGETAAKVAGSAGKTAASAAANAGDAVSKAAGNAGALATRTAKATGEAVVKAKDKAVEFADTHQVSIEEVISTAAKVPGVHVDREKYLMGALRVHATEQMAREAVEKTPALAGVPEDLIDRLAQEAINYENNLATATSAAAGLPSNVTIMVGATVADLGQFYAHVMRVAQKLGYLYGWEDIFGLDGDKMDDATRNAMILFLGVMSGVSGAEKTLMAVAKNAGLVTGKRVARQALTKGTIYPIVKKIAYYLGLQMNKQIFGRAVGHTIPILGGVVSGVITRATFAPMAKRLKDYLAEMPLAKPANAFVAEAEDVDIEDLSEVERELDQEIEELENS